MIQCTRPAKPNDFDDAVKDAQINIQKLVVANGGLLPDRHNWNKKWSVYRDYMAGEAHYYCAYTGIRKDSPDLAVDHFVPKEDHPLDAYRWENYRISWHWINNRKKRKMVLDPYLVQRGWFKITIPGFQLVINLIPDPAILQQAQKTLEEKAGLDLNNPKLVQIRTSMYQRLVLGDWSLKAIDEAMPLLGEAIRLHIIGFVSHQNEKTPPVAVKTTNISEYLQTTVDRRTRTTSMATADAQKLINTLCAEHLLVDRNDLLFTI